MSPSRSKKPVATNASKKSRADRGCKPILPCNSVLGNGCLASSVKSRYLGGVSYWLKLKAPLTTTVMADFEQVNYDTPLAKPTEKRFEIKTQFIF